VNQPTYELCFVSICRFFIPLVIFSVPNEVFMFYFMTEFFSCPGGVHHERQPTMIKTGNTSDAENFNQGKKILSVVLRRFINRITSSCLSDITSYSENYRPKPEFVV
jgi:hypothetical protein